MPTRERPRGTKRRALAANEKPLREGALECWSTRPGSQAPAAKRHARYASRAKLGRELADAKIAKLPIG
jgi:hypothetical protein